MTGQWLKQGNPGRWKWSHKPLERKQRDHMSRQFTYVTHGSFSPTPPHLVDPNNRSGVDENSTDDSFHAGTMRAAWARLGERANRGPHYYHTYKVHRDAMSPIIMGDRKADQYSGSNLKSELRGMQTGLFEDVSMTEDDIRKNEQSDDPKALPYRNAFEDDGSISFSIPKSKIGNGVEYLGKGHGSRFEPGLWTDREMLQLDRGDTTMDELAQKSKITKRRLGRYIF